MLGEGSGLDVLRAARRRPERPEVILATAHAASHTAAQAMQEGAYEYIVKPYSLEEIGRIVRRIAQRRTLVGEAPAAVSPGARELIADSAAMRAVLELAESVAAVPTTVLLRGESGTGKEEIARRIHERSARAGGAFVPVNCGAIPESLLASELFGHERGAFTGAVSSRKGAFERADGGTLLLDEVGDIPLTTQVHLLRAIETREILRVGGSAPVAVDTRIIAATHRDLEDLVRRGAYREDLYYRINVYSIRIPPLRERPGDIPGLVALFLGQGGCAPDRMTAGALEALVSYAWPGNARELRNVVENLVIRSRGGAVTADLVRSVLPSVPVKSGVGGGAETLAEAEARRIREALAQCGGNKAEAARRLGITRRRLYSRMKVLGIGA
jgi:DNA-binding NtrC family response regulator